MSEHLPRIITLNAESRASLAYDNHPIANINDHVVRISTMTEPYPWHSHPNSDETFLMIEGCLCIEFESGWVELHPGQLITIPRGVRHSTRPVGARSVNLTFELAQSETIKVPETESLASGHLSQESPLTPRRDERATPAIDAAAHEQ